MSLNQLPGRFHARHQLLDLICSILVRFLGSVASPFLLSLFAIFVVNFGVFSVAMFNCLCTEIASAIEMAGEF